MRTRVVSKPRPLTSSLSRFSSAAAACVALSLATEATAATLFWDPLGDGNGAVGGTGTWNTLNARWDLTGNDPATPLDNVIWPNGAADIAVFRGTAGTVTIDNSLLGITAGGLTFGVSGYTLTGLAGEVLTLGGATSTITVTNAADSATISVPLAGSSSLVFPGAGSVTLQTAGTRTGTTSVNGGTVTVTDVGALGSGNVTVQNGATLVSAHNAAGQSFPSNVILTGGTFRQNQAQQLSFAAGTALTVGTGTNVIDVSGGIGAASKVFLTAGQLTGSGAFTKTGTGDLQLGGANLTFTGATTVSAGILELQDFSALGGATGGTITVGGTGEVVLSGVAVPNAITLNTGGTLSSNGSGGADFQGAINVAGAGNVALRFFQSPGTPNNLKISGTLSGSGALNVSAPAPTGTAVSSLLLTGNNTAYTGTITAGPNAQVRALEGTGVDALGSAPITLSGGTLGISPVVTAATNAGIQGRWFSTTQIGNGVIGGFDFGLQTPVANSTTTNATLNIGDVTLQANRPAGITTGVNLGVLWTGVLNIGTGGSYTFSTSTDDGSLIYIDGQPVVLNDFSQGVVTRSGVISLGAGAHSIIVKYGQGGGGGSVVANYSGPDTSNVSVFIGSVANTLTNNGAVIQGTSTIDNPISLAAGTISSIDLAATTVTNTGSITFGKGARVNVTGLTGSETFTQQGTVTLNGESTLGTGVAQVTNNAQNQSAGADVIISSVVGEAAAGSSLVKAGPRSLTLSATNTYTGLTVLSGGTLNLNAALGNSVPGNLLLNAALLNSSVTAKELANNQIPDNAVVTLVGYSGIGGSNLDLNGFNDTIGPVNIINNQGTSGETVSTGTGTLTLNGNVTIAGTSTGANSFTGNLNLGGANRTFNVTGLGAAAITAVVSNGGIVKTGLAGLTLSGVNTYSGLTTVNTGKLSISNAAALGATTAGGETVVNAGGYLDIVNVTTAEPITLNGRGQPNLANTGVNNFGLNFTGALQGSGGFLATASGPITLGSNSAVGAVAGSLLTISGVISDGGSAFSLTKTQGNAAALIGTGAATGGPGIVKLTGVNTYTGPTIVEAGDLWLAGTGQTLASTSVVIGTGTSDAALTAVTTNNQFAPNTILTFNGGSKNAKFQLNGTTQTIAGFNVSGNLAIIQNHEVAGATAGTLIVNNPADTSFSGLMRDQISTLALTKQGVGTLTLSGNGALSVNSGTGGAIYTGATTVSAGKLVINDETLFNSPITISGTGAVDFNYSFGRSLVLSKVITDGGLGFTKSGPGNVALSGINAVTGQVNVTGGVLNLTDATGNVNPLPGAPINVSAGAQVQFFGVSAVTTTFDNNITLNGLTPGGAFSGAVVGGTPTNTLTGTLTLAATSNISTGWSDKTLNLTGKITGAGGLVFDKLLYTQNPPVFNISNVANDYAGGTTINTGTVAFADGTLPATGNLKFGGTFGNGGNFGTGQLVLGTGGLTGFTRTIGTGAGQVQFTGDGGGFTAVGSVQTVTFGNVGPLSWTGTGTTGLDANASLVFNTGNNANNEVAVTNDINLNSGVRRIVTGAANSRFTGVISGASELIFDGAGTHNLTGSNANTYTGLTNLSGGTLILAKTGGNAINGDVQISSNQGGTRRILRLGASDQIADTSTLTFVGSNTNNGDFRLFGFNETVGAIQDRSGGGVIEVVDQAETSTSAGSVLTVSGNGDSFYNGFIRNFGGTPTVSGILSLTKSGTGTLTISAGQQSGNGNQNYSGATTVNGGKLVFANIGTYSSPVTINVGGTLEFLANVNQTLTDGQVISGVGNVIKSGVGTIVLSAANAYSGTTTVNAGTLQITGTTDAAQTGAYTVNSSGTLLIGNGTTGGVLTNNNNITVNAGGVVAFSRNNAYAYSGIISGAGSVDGRTGGGVITLSGANTYSGSTSVNGGTIVLGGAGASAGGVLVNTGGTLTVDFGQSGSSLNNVLVATAPVTLRGGTLNILGKAATTNAQTVAGVTADIGVNTLAVTEGAGGTMNANLGTITHNIGGVLNVTFPATGTVTTTTPAIGGILGGFATTGGNTWLALAAGSLTPLTTYGTTYGAGINTDVVASGAGATTNSLRFNTAAANTVTLTGTNTINSGGILVSAAVGANTSTITGGTVRGSASGDLVVIQNNPTGDLVIASTIVDNGGATGLTKAGAGNLVLSGTNTYTGNTVVSQGTLISTGSLGTGLATALSGATLQIGNGTINGVLPNFGPNAGTVIIANGAAQALASPFNAGSEFAFTTNPLLASSSFQTGVLIKSGAGILTVNVPVLANQFHQRAGETVIDTGGNVLVSNFSSIGLQGGDNAALTLKGVGRYTVLGDLNVSDLTASVGTLNIRDQGVVTAGNLFVGKSGTAVGVVNQAFGTVQRSGGSADWRIGGSGSASDVGAYGIYNLSGGAFSTSVNFQIGAFGLGVFNQTGGTATTTGGFPDVGRFGGANGLLNISNGTFTNSTASTSLIVGEQGTGVLNLSGIGILSLPTTSGGGVTGLRLGHAAGGVGIANLDGGTMITNGVSMGAGTGVFNFNGGVLRAGVASTTFMTGLTNAFVYSGGANIDTNGLAITIGQALLGASNTGVTSATFSPTGTGYVGEPIVTFTGGTPLGGLAANAATARAIVVGGAITGYTITNPGNYTVAPTGISFLGGGGTGATAVPTTAANANTGGLTKLNAGVLTLTTPATYGGSTTITGGSITESFGTVAGTNILPATGLVINGGGLTLTGFAAGTNTQAFSSTTLSSTGTIAANIGTGGTMAANLGAITRNAGSAVDFSGTGTISTPTANTGTTILGGWATFGSGANWAVSAGDGTTAGLITALPAASYTANTWAAGNNTDMTTAGTVASLTTNSVRFNTATPVLVTITGTDVITTGGILLTPTTTTAATIFTGGTLNSGGATTDLVVNHFGTGTATIVSAIGAATGGLVKVGPGVLILGSPTATNVYTGATTVGAGTLRLAVVNQIPDGSTVTVNGGATFDLNSFSETINGLAGFGTVTTGIAGTPTLTIGSGGANSTFSGIFTQTTGTLAITKSGAGTLTLNNLGTNTYTGATTISAGAIKIATPAALSNNTAVNVNSANGLLFDTTIPVISGLGGSGTFALQTTGTSAVPNAAVQLTVGNNNAGGTYTGALTGLGTLIKIGTGFETLTGANTNSGGVVVSGGTLAVSGNNSAAGGSMLVNSGGILQVNALNAVYGSTGRTIAVATGGVVSPQGFTANATSTGISSITALMNRIDPNSTGVLALQADASLQAPITENLDFAAAGLDLSLGALLTANGGFGNTPVQYTGLITPKATTFRIGGGNGRLILSNGATLAGANNLNIGGNGTFTGQLFLTGSYGFTGGTVINSGGTTIVSTLANGGTASSLGASSSAAANLVLNGGTLQYVGTGASTDRLFTLTNAPTTLDASGTGPVNFTNSGAIAFSNSGNRTLTLQGNNTAANTIAAALSDSFNIAGAAGALANGVTTVVKNGNGTWAFGGTNTFSGGVTINNGVLAFSGPTSIGSNTVNGPASVLVNSGGAVALGAGFSFTGGLQTALTRISPLSAGTVALTANSNDALNFDGGASGATLPTAFLGAYGNVNYTGTLTPFGNTYRLGGGGGILTMSNGGLTGPRVVQIGGGGPGAGFGNGPNLNGAVVLGGTSDYSGGTILNTGAMLSITNLTALGTGPLKFQGGFYRATTPLDITLGSDGTSAREIRIGTDASGVSQTANVDVASGVNLNFSKTFGPAATLGSNLGQQNFTKWGAGSLVLANGINLDTSNGTNNIATNSGTLTIERGTLSILNNPTSYNGLIQVGSNNGGVGTLKLAANNVFGGGNSLQFLSGSIIDTFSGSKLDLSGFSDTIRIIRGMGSIVNTGASTANLTVGTANDNGILGGNLVGNFMVTKAGTVTNLFGTGAAINSLELWNNNNAQFTGKFVVNAGGLRLRADGTLGASTEPFAADKITINNNAVLLSSGGTNLVINANHGITLGAGGGTLWQFGTTGMVINSPITGSGALTIADDLGAIFLASDNNTWSGGTTINNGNTANRGVLAIGAGGATGSLPAGDVLFNSGATTASAGRLLFFKSTDITVPNNINGPGVIFQIGAGTTTLTGNNTTNQTTVVGGGRLKADFTNSAKTPLGTGTALQLSAGAFEYVGPAGDNTFRLQALTNTVFSGTNGLFAAVMIGGGIGDSVVQSTYGGTGTQTLLFNGIARGTAGVTTNFVTSGGVNGVTNLIRFQSGPALNAPIGASYYFNGSEFAVLDTTGFVRAINPGSDINATALNGLAASQYAKLTNPVTGQASIAVSGVNLSGATASLNMAAAAVLTLNANPGAILKSGGGLSIVNGDTGATVSNNAQEFILRADTAADTLQIDIPITGTGIFTKSGLGQVTLTAANTATGNNMLSQGTVLLTGNGSLGTAASPTGEVRIANAAGQTATLAIDSANASITQGTGANALRVGEAGTGFVTQSNGTVNVANYLTIGESLGSAGTYAISGGTLNVKTNTGTPPAGTAGQNNMVVGRVGTGTVNISANATVNVLNGAQIMLGMGTNNSGQFQGMVPNAALSTGVGTITQTGGTVNVSVNNGVYQSNVIGAVILGVDGTGTYTLNGGTLSAPLLGRGNGTATFNLGGGTLKAAASTLNVDLPVNLTGTGAGKGTIDSNGNDITFTGALTGAGGLTKAGTGVLSVLGNGSTYTGGTDITGGTIVASGSSLGNGQVNVGAGGTLAIQGVQQGLLAKFYLVNTTTVTPAVTNGNAGMASELSSLENFRAFLAGKDAVAVESTAARGKVSVNYGDSGGANQNSAVPPAVIAIQNGSIPFVASTTGQFNAATAGDYTFQTRSDDGSAVWIDGQPVLDNNRSQGQTVRSGTVNLTAGLHDIVIGYTQGTGGSGFSVGVTLPDQGQSFTLGSELNMSNALLSFGSNQLTVGSLAGAGTVQIGAGTLLAGSDNSSTIFSGSISGGGGTFRKQGLGTMTINGTQSYTGPTIVESGTLNVGTSATVQGSIAGSAVTVQSGAKLGGSGALGSLSALTGSTIAPGNGLLTVGQLAVANGLSLSSGSTLTLDLGNTQGTAQPAATDYDSLNVTGTVSLGGSLLNVSLLNAGIHFAGSTGDVFYVILNDGADAVSGNFVGCGSRISSLLSM